MSCLKAMANYKVIIFNGGGTEKTAEDQKKERLVVKLPRVMKPNKKSFESIGFSFEEIEDDNVLTLATLPEGWTIKPGIGYWSYLIDEKGRNRGSIFYKTTFYDRKGHMALRKRIHITYEFLEEVDSNPISVCALDERENIIYCAGRCEGLYTEDYYNLVNMVSEYLLVNYPEWENPTKYWDFLFVKDKDISY